MRHMILTMILLCKNIKVFDFHTLLRLIEHSAKTRIIHAPGEDLRKEKKNLRSIGKSKFTQQTRAQHFYRRVQSDFFHWTILTKNGFV